MVRKHFTRVFTEVLTACTSEIFVRQYYMRYVDKDVGAAHFYFDKGECPDHFYLGLFQSSESIILYRDGEC